MEEHIEFNFIYSDDALRVKTFLGNVPRSIECINYMDIFNKLTKNDYYQYEPSDAVVSSYLMRQLQNAIGRNISTTIFYVLGNLNKDNFLNIWTSDRSYAARNKLNNANRCFAPCNKWDVVGDVTGKKHADAWKVLTTHS